MRTRFLLHNILIQYYVFQTSSVENQRQAEKEIIDIISNNVIDIQLLKLSTII